MVQASDYNIPEIHTFKSDSKRQRGPECSGAADSSSTFPITGGMIPGTTEKAFAAGEQIDAGAMTAHYLRHAWR